MRAERMLATRISYASKRLYSTQQLQNHAAKADWINPSTSFEAVSNQLKNIIENNITIQRADKHLLNIYWKFQKESGHGATDTRLLRHIDPNLFTRYVIKHSYIKAIRKLCRHELIFSSKDLTLCNKLINGLKWKPRNNKITAFDSPVQVLRCCLDDSFKRGDDVNAVELFLSYYKVHPDQKPNQKDLDDVLVKLSVPNPTENHLRLENFISLNQLINSYDMKLNFSRVTLENWYNIFINQESRNPQLVKEASDIILDYSFIQDQTLKLKIAYMMIESDIRKTNFTGAFMCWLKIKGLTKSIHSHDSKILASLLKTAVLKPKYMNFAEDIFMNLSKEKYSNDPILLPAIISYVLHKNSITLAKEIVADMKLYTTNQNQQIIWKSKETLLALFNLQLAYYNDDNINKILNQVIQLYGKVSSEFYILTVSFLLKTEKVKNVKRAIKVLDSMSDNETYSTCASIILCKLIYWEMNNQTLPSSGYKLLVNELIMKMDEKDPNHEQTFWLGVINQYLKYFITIKSDIEIGTSVKCLNPLITAEVKEDMSKKLDLVKYIYIKSNIDKLKTNTAENSLIINPFIEIQQQNIRFKPSKRANIKILKNMAITSLKISRFDMFQWCCSMLYNEGFSKEELIFLWNVTINRPLREMKIGTLNQLRQSLATNEIMLVRKLLE